MADAWKPPGSPQPLQPVEPQTTPQDPARALYR